MNARVPTLPTPTTLRAMSTHSNRSSSSRRSSCSVSRYARNCSCTISLESVDRVAVGLRQVAQRNDHRRLADDPVSPVDELGELRQRLQAVARVRLPCRLLRVLLGGGRLPSGPHPSAELAAASMAPTQVLLGQPRVPDVHRAHLGELRPSTLDTPSPTASSAARPSALVKPLLRAAIVKLAAMRFTSYSKGPGSVSSKSFRSNSELPLRRCERTEVREVRVAAELHVEPSRRRVLQVRGHDLRRAPVERERRDHHAPVAHRHEIRLTRGVLLLEQRQPGPGDPPPASIPNDPTAALAHVQTSHAPCARRHSDA